MAAGPWEAAGTRAPGFQKAGAGRPCLGAQGPGHLTEVARQAGSSGARRAVGEMIRTPPRGPPGAGDRRTWRPSEASDQEVSGSGHALVRPLG